MTQEEIEDFMANYETEYFEGAVFGEFAYTYQTVLQMLKDHEVLIKQKILSEHT